MRIFAKPGRAALAAVAGAVLAGAAGFAGVALAQVPPPAPDLVPARVGALAPAPAAANAFLPAPSGALAPLPPGALAPAPLPASAVQPPRPGGQVPYVPPLPGVPAPAPPTAPTVSPAPALGQGSVPSARFYGTVASSTGGTITAAIGGTPCGTGTVSSSGSYTVDIESVPGCTTPGSSVVFTVGTQAATPTGSLPDLPGTAVQLNLTLAAPTPVATPRPIVPTVTAPPPPPVTTPPPVVRTATAVAVQAPKVQGPKSAQGPKAAVKGPFRGQAPAYRAPVYGQGGAPAVAPRLPSTGTGGLLDQSSAMSGWTLAAMLLAAVAMGGSGLVAYRKRQ
jgi:hypothetical protein